MIVRLDDAFQHNRRFLADASHELRTPLTIMRGELEYIVDKTPLELRSPAHRRQPSLRKSNASPTLSKDCSPSRVWKLAKRKKEWLPFDLSEIIAVTPPTKCACSPKTRASPSPPMQTARLTVNGDRARVKQVLVNLLDNAIKYTPQAEASGLTVADFKDKAILEVEDNGIGIPINAQSRIFERFFRVEKARSRELGGAGLGLPL